MTTVDIDGTNIRVRAIAYGTAVVADRVPGGGLIVFNEQWTDGSVVLPDQRVRLQLQHDAGRPVGWLERWSAEDDGVYAEGRLVGARANLDQLRTLVAEDLMSDVSVSFTDSEDDQWNRPSQRGGLPTVTRRGVKLREVSIVSMAAIPNSRVLSIEDPNSKQARLHAESDRLLAGTRARMAAEAADRHAYVQGELAKARAAIDAGARWTAVREAVAEAEREPEPVLTREAVPIPEYRRRGFSTNASYRMALTMGYHWPDE